MGSQAATGAASAPATYRAVFTNREFRALWLSQVSSAAGDQLAAVALAVLAFQRTGSALVSGAAYAVAFLPWVLGGPLLAGLADRQPRREVMIICDLARMALVMMMALLAWSIPALLTLLFLVALLDSPFRAARAALLPDVLGGDAFVVGSSVVLVTAELAQVLGVVSGGVLVTALTARGALAVDAGSFLLSAALLLRGVGHRTLPARSAVPIPARPTGAATLARGSSAVRAAIRAMGADVRCTARLMLTDPSLRPLVALALLCACYVVPEALAVPYAAAAGYGATAAGALLAANPAGTIVGSLWLSRAVGPPRRLRLMGPLAVLSCAPLVGCVVEPGLPVAWLLWFLSGFGAAYNLPANAAFVTAVPAERRGRAVGLVTSGMAVGQGLALLTAGAAATAIHPGPAIALFGAAGVGVALRVAAALARREAGSAGRCR